MITGRTDGRAEAAIGEIADGLLAQNEGTTNPMVAELDSVGGINNRWAAVVAGLLILTASVYEETPSPEPRPKTPAGETTQHNSGAFLDR